MNIGEHLLRKYGGRDPEDDPGPPPPGSWVAALCIVVIGVPAAIGLVTLAWNEQAAAKALVALGVHATADQRGYDATPALVVTLTAAAMEWAADKRERS